MQTRKTAGFRAHRTGGIRMAERPEPTATELAIAIVYAFFGLLLLLR